MSQMVRNLLIILTICGFVVSCKQETLPSEIKEQTIILYIIANNNLESQGKFLFNEIEGFLKTEYSESINLVVIYRNRKTTKLFSNENRQLMLRKEYGSINSLSKKHLSNILSDICKTFPAKEIGIAFWSHGTGWLPSGNNVTRSFGDDNGESIDVYDLAESLNITFDFIIFDACYMGGIEVATELQKHSKYFIASPTTVPTMGIIDATSIGILIQDCPLSERLVALCKNFYETKDVPIALLDLEQMNSFIDAITLLEIDHSQIFRDITKYTFRTCDIFFDMYSLFKRINDRSVLRSLNQILLFPQNIEEDCFVSVFIPTEDNESYWNNYSTTSWNNQTGWLSKWK